jgi:hypothetical protein
MDLDFMTDAKNRRQGGGFFVIAARARRSALNASSGYSSAIKSTQLSGKLSVY